MTQQAVHVRTGLDVLVDENFVRLRGKRVALLGHPASIDRHHRHLVDLVRDAGIDIVRIFGPEHGIYGDAQDMAHVESERDRRTGLPVVSLYGATRESLFLKDSDLAGVDVLVCDLQDIGTRFYTFAYTIAFALQACARVGVRCVVLDRPNPIDGVHIEGNTVTDSQKSFVGEYPLAIRHGMTLGELCHFFAAHDGVAANILDVVWMQGWQRELTFDETDLPWVLPSPNMPTPTTALVYPGGCLWEGTNLSEGRGTTRPFELVGAPYIDDAHRFAELISISDVPGVTARPCYFRPTFQKHAGQLCGGVQLHITDRAVFNAVRAGVAVIWAARQFVGFDWRRTTYEYVSDRLAIDLLFGDSAQRRLLESGASVDDVMESMRAAHAAFVTTRARHLHAAYGAGRPRG